MIWGNLVHLGMNMWCDREIDSWEDPSGPADITENRIARDYLRFEMDLWGELVAAMSEAGVNMVVIDIGEGVKFDSHPEISAKDALDKKTVRGELDRLRGLGIEPIPKFNFSTGHDAWLGEYSRCVSTPRYYSVCRELIEETVELFDGPRFFHLGYDEETAAHQKQYDYVVIRQHELWWHDFYFFVKTVEDLNVRPWIWSDYVWGHEAEFFEKMPKSVLQSNWFYFTGGKDWGFDEETIERYRDAFVKLEKHGYDQVPTASNWLGPDNLGEVVEFCREHIGSERLKGFMHSSWLPTLAKFKGRHFELIDQLGKEIRKW